MCRQNDSKDMAKCSTSPSNQGIQTVRWEVKNNNTTQGQWEHRRDEDSH